jgi:pyruvate-formate lyase-activating enzyme
MEAPRGLKYPTLWDLVVAYKKGEMTEPIVLDNDQTTVYVYPEGQREFIPTIVFSGGDPGMLLREALRLLGVPWENV